MASFGLSQIGSPGRFNEVFRQTGIPVNFIISLSNISEQVSVQVNDMQGRLIYSQVEGLRVGKENAISLENVERGVYLISVSSNKGRYTQSIVVQ